MHGMKLAGLELDRKVLSDLAIREPEAFAAIVETAKSALDQAAAGGGRDWPRPRSAARAAGIRTHPGARPGSDCGHEGPAVRTGWWAANGRFTGGCLAEAPRRMRSTKGAACTAPFLLGSRSIMDDLDQLRERGRSREIAAAASPDALEADPRQAARPPRRGDRGDARPRRTRAARSGATPAPRLNAAQGRDHRRARRGRRAARPRRARPSGSPPSAPM